MSDFMVDGSVLGKLSACVTTAEVMLEKSYDDFFDWVSIDYVDRSIFMIPLFAFILGGDGGLGLVTSVFLARLSGNSIVTVYTGVTV